MQTFLRKIPILLAVTLLALTSCNQRMLQDLDDHVQEQSGEFPQTLLGEDFDQNLYASYSPQGQELGTLVDPAREAIRNRMGYEGLAVDPELGNLTNKEIAQGLFNGLYSIYMDTVMTVEKAAGLQQAVLQTRSYYNGFESISIGGVASFVPTMISYWDGVTFMLTDTLVHAAPISNKEYFERIAIIYTDGNGDIANYGVLDIDSGTPYSGIYGSILLEGVNPDGSVGSDGSGYYWFKIQDWPNHNGPRTGLPGLPKSCHFAQNSGNFQPYQFNGIPDGLSARINLWEGLNTNQPFTDPVFTNTGSCLEIQGVGGYVVGMDAPFIPGQPVQIDLDVETVNGTQLVRLNPNNPNILPVPVAVDAAGELYAHPPISVVVPGSTNQPSSVTIRYAASQDPNYPTYYQAECLEWFTIW